MSSSDIVLAAAGAAGGATYVEDVFSTWLYTGNDSTQTINNGIDLAGKGGMVWTKARTGTIRHAIFDTARSSAGAGRYLSSNLTDAQATSFDTDFGGFNNNGYSLNGSTYFGALNFSPNTYASWTFRKQPKFFDVVTYTGNGSGSQTINHGLTSQPGMIIIKRTDSTSDWQVFARNSSTTYSWLQLNNANASGGSPLQSNVASSSVINVGWITSNFTTVNGNGASYVAYLFAHNAGGFGLSGNENVISCGTFTTDSSWNATVNLGYEPQFLLYKSTSFADAWVLIDTMRNWSVSGGFSYLQANLSSAELTYSGGRNPTATGFEINTGMPNATYIYMAIRRGPMATPTSGTSVFDAGQNTTSLANQINGTIGPVDLTMQTQIPTPLSTFHFTTFDRLRGSVYVTTSTTNAETTGSVFFDTNSGVRNGQWFSNGGVFYNFRRAPGFFDVVCYTGTGGLQNIAHNLGAAPEFIITKRRSSAAGWNCYSAALGNAQRIRLELTDASSSDELAWASTSPTSSVFTVGASLQTNLNGQTYVAYLFATVAGVSKVGSYTGTGGTQTINAGLPTGARFVLIKRTDSTGNWWVWDTARGMISGTDPRLALNVADAQINQNWVFTTTNGFQIVTSDATINASGGSYIYLAIA